MEIISWLRGLKVVAKKLCRAYLGCMPGFKPFSLAATDLLASYPPVFPNLDWIHVPIHIINDGARIGLSSDLLGLFRSIEFIEENERFQKKLEVLPPSVRNAWPRTKARMQDSLAMPGLDF